MNTKSANQNHGRAGGPELNGSPLFDEAFIPNLQDVDWGPAPAVSTVLEPSDVFQPLYDEAYIPSLQDVDWGPAPEFSIVLEPTDVVQHQVYFGRRRRDGTVVPEAEWEDFERTNLSAAFPGYTVIDGLGGWPDPAEGFIREPSKLVIANVPANQRFVGATVAALALVWKTQAKQVSVLWVRSSAIAVNL